MTNVIAIGWSLLCLMLAVPGLRSLAQLREQAWLALGQANVAQTHIVIPRMMHHGGALIGLLAAIVGTQALGTPVRRWILPASPAPDRRVYGLLWGVGAGAVLLHGLGLASLFDVHLIGFLAMAVLVLGGTVLIRNRRHLVPSVPRTSWAPALATILAVVAAFVVARLPDSHEDARVYHLAAPESYLREHKIHAEALNVNWHMPRGAEMIFSMGWALNDIEGAKLANLVFAVAAISATGRFAAALLGPVGGWWAAAWIATTGLMVGEAWGCKNDLALLAYIGAAGSAVTMILGGGGARWLPALAFSLGLAAGVKFTSGFALIGLGLATARWWSALSVNRLLVLASLFALPSAGWLAESWLFLGNPLHPFLSGFFPDITWSPFYQRGLSGVMRAISPDAVHSRADWLAGLWRAFGDSSTGSPALAALVPLTLLSTKRGWPFAWILAAYLAWLPTERNARYLYPLAAPMAVLAASASLDWPRLRRLWLALVVTMPWIGSAHLLAPNGWLYLSGIISRPEYLSSRFTTWEETRHWINTHVPASTRILLSGEERRLWFTPRVVGYLMVHEPLIWRITHDSRTTRDISTKLRQRHITHILHNFLQAEYRPLVWFSGPEWTDRQLALYTAFARTRMEPIRSPLNADDANGGFWIFRLHAEALPHPQPVHFLPFTEGLFHNAYSLHRRGHHLEALQESRRVAVRLPGVGAGSLFVAKMVAETGDAKAVRAILGPLEKTGFVADHDLRLLGGACLISGNDLEAWHAFVGQWKATQEAPELIQLASILFRKAKGEELKGRYSLALRHLEAAYGCAPLESEIPVEEAKIYSLLGRRDEDLRASLRAHQLAPHEQAITTLLETLRSRGSP